MTREQYHHGTLKKDLIQKGLLLLNRDGYDGFSLRKVAILCGVSHAAPYKHFSSKEELINAITMEVVNDFATTMKTAVEMYPDNPSKQILEMGRQYVKFMVENPEYMKFMVLSDNSYPILIQNNEFSYVENNPFDMFKTCVEKYFDHEHIDKENRVLDILTMWSLVHGIAILIVNKSIIYEGNYLDLVTMMIIEKLHIKLS